MLVYLTSKRYPASTADHLYVYSLARAFAGALGSGFELIISGPAMPELSGVRTRSIRAPRRARTLYYFFWFPAYASSLSDDAIIFSNDLNLLAITIIWRTLLRKRYRIASDWHLLTGTWKDTFVARRSDFLIATSQRLKEMIVMKTGVAAKRVHVVYGGVDLTTYAAPLPSRTELGLPSGSLIGYVGGFKTLGKEKGIRTMIEALRYLPPDFTMIFVGGKPEEIAEYAAYAASLNAADRCVWFGWQSSERVAAYERSMDVLVIPYPDEPHFRDYGFPMKVWEYLAAGKPIAYSDLAILREALEGKGERFTPGDAKDLARAVVAGSVRTGNLEGARGYSWEAKAASILRLIEAP